MKGGLDEVSLPNFVAAAEGALARSGATLADVSYLCGIHMKRSMHTAIAEALGVPLERAAYLDDTGHMSGVDPLLALDRAVRAGDVADGDLVLLLAAGTGYTWAASVIRWGPARPEGRRRSHDERVHGADRQGARPDRVVRGRRRSGSTSSRRPPTTRSGSTPTPCAPRRARSGRRSRTGS